MFNLENYEDVDTRIHKFYATYEDGAIITELISNNEENSSLEMAKVNDSQASSAPIRVRTEEHKKFINEHNPNAEVIWDTTIEPPADLEPAFEDAADLVIKNLGAEPVPRCKHGNRVLREGTGKNGPYRGYGCSLPMKMKSEQCKMVWMVLDQNGKWSFRDEDADLIAG